MFEGTISQRLVEKVESIDGELDFDTVAEGIPVIVRKMIPMEEVEGYFLTLTGEKEDIALKLGDTIERVIIGIVSNVIGYVLAFVISFIVCSIVMFIIEKFCELPVLGWLNRIGGVLWGVANAYLVTSFIVLIVSFIFGADFINQTIVARIIYNIGLFTI
jgi:hypothetical protein